MKHLLLKRLNNLSNNPLKIIGFFGVLLALSLLIWGFFSSEDALQDLLSAMGPAAPILFIFIQTTQTVTPFIPAALIIPIGLLLFGVSSGFVLSFIGLTMGSVINFKLARKFGPPLVEMFVSGKQFEKYTKWMEDEERFDRLFAFGMFFPFTPSDLLTYIAGLSDISFKKYLSITSLSKVFTLFLYTYGIAGVLRILLPFLN